MGAHSGAVDMSFTIRDATAGDQAAWRVLWQAYLTFYDVTLDAAITDHTWARMMSAESRVKMRLAVDGDHVLGFAIHHYHASTWVLGDDCYLEDLFVDASLRGSGIGRALIADLQAVAVARGWKRLYWHTDQGNGRARKLYDSIVPSDGHIRYRIKL